jgi:hypothetical protein
MLQKIIFDSHRSVPWIQQLAELIQEQAQQIQEQKQRIQEQSEAISALKKTVEEQRDEIKRLKKLPKRPKFRPGGGKPRSRSGKPSGENQKNASGDTAAMQKTKEEKVIAACDVPPGSRFKGYQDYTVQELELIAKDVTYRLEVWQAPNGQIIRAKLPKEIKGSHFGHQLRALLHHLYALGMTQPGLFEFAKSCGIEVAEGQIHHILMNEADGYQQTSEEILKAGIEKAPYIRTDDTGAKHQHKNHYCTHIGGEYFSYFKTTPSKSRDNFLNILLQGKEGYIINQACLWHLFTLGVEDDLLNHLEKYKGKSYRKKSGLNRLLNSLGIGSKKLRRQCIEAGLIGFISETILKPGQVLLSDRAGQFAIFNHAACWVHMERPLRKLQVESPQVERELAQVRDAIWDLYDKTKEAARTQIGKEEVHRLFDQLLEMRSTSPGINEVIASFGRYREELLKALDHSGLPLHNNDSERDIRSVAKRRNISGSTKSQTGKAYRDSLLTLRQTCARLGISFMQYLRSWFAAEPMDLACMVRAKYQEANSVS